MQKLLTVFHKKKYRVFENSNKHRNEISPYIIIFDSTDLLCESKEDPLFFIYNPQHREVRVTLTFETRYPEFRENPAHIIGRTSLEHSQCSLNHILIKMAKTLPSNFAALAILSAISKYNKVMTSKELSVLNRIRFNSLLPGKFFMLLCHLLIFFKINFFEKFFQEYHQNVKQFWILIRPDSLSGLIWVQIVCKSYQETILVGNQLKAELEQFNPKILSMLLLSHLQNLFKFN